MHRFLRAIGFCSINNRKDLDNLLGLVMEKPDKRKEITVSDKKTYTEFSKEFGPQLGLSIRGEYDARGFFYMEHYFPYCESRLVTSKEDISVNKRVDTNAFTGMCDDMRLGISIIFYLQNAVDYMRLNITDNTPHPAQLTLSGLSLSGMILLGTEQDSVSMEQRKHHIEQRNHLIMRAKKGDQEAIDKLTIDEIDLSARVRRRIKNEDLYTLVESCFIPYGSESDNYSILGTIINWSLNKNIFTGEEIYLMLLNCNDILLTISINKQDLLGEPAIGRRFKGVIWMQGHASFTPA